MQTIEDLYEHDLRSQRKPENVCQAHGKQYVFGWCPDCIKEYNRIIGSANNEARKKQ